MRIAVVGAGIIGMTSAVAIKNDFPHADVTVFAELFSPETTGDGSAGLWGPFVLGNTSDKDIIRWSGDAHKWMEGFWKSPLALEVGISLVHTFRFTNDPKGYTKPYWSDLVYGAEELKTEDLERINKEYKSNYSGGWHFLTYTCESIKMLPWLMKKFQSQGGKIEKRKVQTIEELKKEQYDTVVNCSGLGARELVCDHLVTPVRGQISRVNATWIFHAILEEHEDGNYIIPNIHTVILGGTRQKNDFNVSTRKEDSKFIHGGCARIIPAVNNSTILKEWTGLRPGRSSVRVEAEIQKNQNSTDFIIIHNYGHGGAGVTLSWGCALDVVKMLKRSHFQNRTSKL